MNSFFLSLIAAPLMSGMQTTIENDWIQVVLLPDKGCNIAQLIDRQTGFKILTTSTNAEDQIKKYIAAGKKSKFYGEHYEGGWQQVIPCRFGVGDTEDLSHQAGEAATVPWVFNETNSPVKDLEWSLKGVASKQLDVAQLEVTRKFYLSKKRSSLRIETTILNIREYAVNINWNEHPAFGGDLLEGDFQIELPQGDVCAKPFIPKGGGVRDLTLLPKDRFIVPGTNYSLEDYRPPQGKPDLFLTMKSVSDAKVCIRNMSKKIKMEMIWDKKTLPHLWYWAANKEQVKTIALEPSSNWLPNYPDARIAGILTAIPAKGSIQSWIEIHLSH